MTKRTLWSSANFKPAATSDAPVTLMVYCEYVPILHEADRGWKGSQLWFAKKGAITLAGSASLQQSAHGKTAFDRSCHSLKFRFEPAFLQLSTLLLVVLWPVPRQASLWRRTIMTGSGKWDCSDQLSLHCLVQRRPCLSGWPPSISGHVSTAIGCTGCLVRCWGRTCGDGKRQKTKITADRGGNHRDRAG